ncbi:Ubiquitin-conjugating enzyme E2 pex4 [Lasiodiplodia hormozganensis]|uniref:Ubiquitin-conjugating enzyme E2 pex4 n=2 Tax=Lasiodiplodia TaxID=66739 RepID=A0A5N5DVU2_9PEZI|nr:Ubiquitin-conjugating enzyme [Lasiodiplodia theobromae]KAB2581102.1 Ubiquitin-conjugating enzyme E2 pex4 [Lasiodiplodia theobromae]KAF4539951.1 Ubiquitin-conjugating enzyme [Lasiodiplodia theobromae]KAK0664341.1 Ubiquitin-conjugating enzyme E2 pex4 [Lasiodiplodia hormozganensis]
MASRSSQTPVKRLLVELQSYQSDPNDALQRLGPVNDDELTHWQAVMKGVSGTPYENGRWLLDIRIPSTYPLAAPEVKFVTPICHPNVHFKTGEICLDTLKAAWSPAFTISTTMTSVHQLLTSAEPDSPLNIDIAQLLRQGDMVGYDSLIRFYTETERYEGR